jgi:hypothetical protein
VRVGRALIGQSKVLAAQNPLFYRHSQATDFRWPKFFAVNSGGRGWREPLGDDGYAQCNTRLLIVDCSTRSPSIRLCGGHNQNS